MKINMLLSGCLLGLLCFTACDSEGNEMNDYTTMSTLLLVQEAMDIPIRVLWFPMA